MRPLLQQVREVGNMAAVINAGFLLVLVLVWGVGASAPVKGLVRWMEARRYYSPVQGVPDEVKLAKVKEAIAIATVDGTFWNPPKTVEEYYEGVYNPENPPPYWNTIRDDFALGKRLGSVELAELPPYSSLTRKERLLLCPVDDIGWPLETVSKLQRDSKIDARRGERERAYGNLSWGIQRCVSSLPDSFVLSQEPLSPEAARKFLMWMDDLPLNPMANRMMEVTSREFSAGDAYAEYHYADEEWKRLMPGYTVYATGYSPQEAQNHGLLYYRIYGEKRIIAEGVRANRWAASRARFMGLPTPLAVEPRDGND